MSKLTTGWSPRSTSCASPRRSSGTSLRRPAVHKFEKNGTDNGTQNAKASSGGVAIEWPCIGRLLRSREKPIRAFEDFLAKSVGGRSIRKRLARSSSIASAAIIASLTIAKATNILALSTRSGRINNKNGGEQQRRCLSQRFFSQILQRSQNRTILRTSSPDTVCANSGAAAV